MYAPPAPDLTQGSPVILNYNLMKQNSGRTSYFKVRLPLNIALYLADRSPFPNSAKLGVMQQFAMTKDVSLAQLQIILSWAARKAQKSR